jgi:hypothetical protein
MTHLESFVPLLAANDIFQVAEIPRTLSGKKQELPIKNCCSASRLRKWSTKTRWRIRGVWIGMWRLRRVERRRMPKFRDIFCFSLRIY